MYEGTVKACSSDGVPTQVEGLEAEGYGGWNVGGGLEGCPQGVVEIAYELAPDAPLSDGDLAPDPPLSDDRGPGDIETYGGAYGDAFVQTGELTADAVLFDPNAGRVWDGPYREEAFQRDELARTAELPSDAEPSDGDASRAWDVLSVEQVELSVESLPIENLPIENLPVESLSWEGPPRAHAQFAPPGGAVLPGAGQAPAQVDRSAGERVHGEVHSVGLGESEALRVARPSDNGLRVNPMHWESLSGRGVGSVPEELVTDGVPWVCGVREDGPHGPWTAILQRLRSLPTTFASVPRSSGFGEVDLTSGIPSTADWALVWLAAWICYLDDQAPGGPGGPAWIRLDFALESLPDRSSEDVVVELVDALDASELLDPLVHDMVVRSGILGIDPWGLPPATAETPRESSQQTSPYWSHHE